MWTPGPFDRIRVNLTQFKTELPLGRCGHLSSRGAGGGVLCPVMTLLREGFRDHLLPPEALALGLRGMLIPYFPCEWPAASDATL